MSYKSSQTMESTKIQQQNVEQCRKDSRGRTLQIGESQMPNGQYRYRYTDKNGSRHSVYSWRLIPTDTLPEGKRNCLSLREKTAALTEYLSDGVDVRLATTVTLNDVFQLYMSGKLELKQSTRTNYFYMYRKFVSNRLGCTKIANIKYSDIKSFYNELIYEKGFKPNSVEIINTILHPVFTLAVRDGYIRLNPCDGVMAEIKRSRNWEKPKRYALSVEEQIAFIAYVANSNVYKRWLPLFTFLLGTGCRIGEVIGLRWSDCDFEEGLISINHNLIYRMQDNEKCEMHITTPKTSAGSRTIPMLCEVKNALLTERERQLATPSSISVDGYRDFVFTNRNGNVHNPQTINQVLERIRCAYNTSETQNAKSENRPPLLIRHFSAHNLRHTFCTRFCENESNIKVIQEIMGHRDIGTTMNIYAEVTESKKKEVFSSLEGKIRIS